jgi:hypothetical protein
MGYLKQIIIAFELQSVDQINLCFENGIDPNQLHKGKPLIYELINMYSRGPAFKACIKTFIDHGLVFEDKILLAVLTDDAHLLNTYLEKDKTILKRLYSLDCTFTPLYEVSLLHICAEYNHYCCAETLIKHGADVNAKAGIDQYGFGGHTPIFHTVNQNGNKCIDAMNVLLANKADLSVTIKGLIWGKGYTWETFVPAVNVISYAMMGLLPQFQRSEKDIYTIVAILLKKQWDIEYYPENIPNKYLTA